MTKNLFIFAGILGLVFGLPLAISPETPARLFLVDSTLTLGAAFTFRGYGILLASVGIGLLAAMNSAPSTARQGLLLMIVIGGACGAISTIFSIIKGASTNNGWIIVIICAIEAIWGAILLSRKQSV